MNSNEELKLLALSSSHFSNNKTTDAEFKDAASNYNTESLKSCFGYENFHELISALYIKIVSKFSLY